MGTPDIDYQKLFQAMNVPRFIVARVQNAAGKQEYQVAEINEPALRFFDQSYGSIQGHKIQDFMDQESLLHFKQSFEASFEKKQSVTIQALPRVPGSIRVFGFYVSPVLDEQGEVEFLDVVGQLDMTDQSALQRERDDALSLLTSIFEVSEVGIIVTDQNGRIVRVNESFIRTYGWSRDELVNGDMISLVTPDERDMARSNHEELIKTGVRSSGELKLIRKNGSIANVLFTTATMELSQRRRFQVTTVMDITLRKKMEESLRLAKDQADTANRAKSTFLANMSHELRTPLNAIIGFSEMMIKETFGALGHDKYKEYISDVHTSAGHLLEIINEVLDMSKIEAERIELDEESVDLQELIKSVMRMMASRAFGNNLTLNVEIEENLPDLVADKRLVRQILINLVANAVKFSNAGGQIDVLAHVDGVQNALEIMIKDQGVGIPKDKIQQAMEPFGQVMDRPENTGQQGTGLGLPLAKAMVELHEGHLNLESDVGQGTTVFVRFPAHRIIPRKSPTPRYTNKNDVDLADTASSA